VPRLDAPRLRAAQESFLGGLRGRPAAPWTGPGGGPGCGSSGGPACGSAGPFLAPPTGGVEHRWAIYSSGYVARLVEALENDYPAVRRILGEGPFGSLTARYVRRFPPRSFDIGRAGERLATFLGEDALAAELRFLPDLARYEWSLAEAFVAADSVPLAWSELTALGPEAVADATFRLRPGTALIRSSWPLLELWGAKDLADADVSIPLEGSPCTVLVDRDGLEVRHRLVGEADARFLEAASHGLRLPALLRGAADETEAAGLVERFRLWVVSELFEKPGPSREAASH
jgi:hypothetical protein